MNNCGATPFQIRKRKAYGGIPILAKLPPVPFSISFPSQNISHCVRIITIEKNHPIENPSLATGADGFAVQVSIYNKIPYFHNQTRSVNYVTNPSFHFSVLFCWSTLVFLREDTSFTQPNINEGHYAFNIKEQSKKKNGIGTNHAPICCSCGAHNNFLDLKMTGLS
ncbi:hypothetical protein ACS0TY_021122 [Phlomoides rotata]